MPTYEYECTSCGQHIEVFQRITEDPLTTCGACGSPLRKVFHPAGIVFKGSGFYATDSRSGSKSAHRAKQEGEGGSSSSPGSSSGSGDGSKRGDSGSKGGDSGSKGGDAGSKSSTAPREPSAS